MSSDEEEEHSEEEEETPAPAPAAVAKETEAELALKKRREASSKDLIRGLDEAAKELLQSNKEDRQRMEDEIKELRQRNERRKKEREVEEKRLAAERNAEEERRKTVEEEKRRKKDEDDQKKVKERANKMAEFEKWKNPSKPNFVISKKSEDGESTDDSPGVVKKSREQIEAEKKAILNQRIVPLAIDGFDQAKLAEKAKELHKLIYRLESEKYDHEKRFKAQQVDMMELAERARQANKVGRTGLKRVQLTSETVDDVQTRFSGTPAKIEMYSKYERQKDKRQYVERKELYTGPQFGGPPDRIKPKKIVKWSEEGLPQYEELAEGEVAAPAAEH